MAEPQFITDPDGKLLLCWMRARGVEEAEALEAVAPLLRPHAAH